LRSQAPEIVALYALNISPSWVRLKIRQDFERNRAITDLKIIDMLLLKNQQEFQETMNCWKQEVGLATATAAVEVGAGWGLELALALASALALGWALGWALGLTLRFRVLLLLLKPSSPLHTDSPCFSP
jgi:hypothetical protein